MAVGCLRCNDSVGAITQVMDKADYAQALLQHGIDLSSAPISKGTYGKVILGKDRRVIAKLQHLYEYEGMRAVRKSFAVEELAILNQLAKEQTPYVSRQIAAYYVEARYYASIQEYGGEHLDQKYGDRGLSLSLIRVHEMAQQLLTALAYLHKPCPSHDRGYYIIHGDIKQNNILENEHRRITLIDFGLAEKIRPDLPSKNQIWKAKYHAWYRPPEGMPQDAVQPSAVKSMGIGKIDTYSDIWATGCVLFELATGKGLFRYAPQKIDEVGGMQEAWIDRLRFDPTLFLKARDRSLRSASEKRRFFVQVIDQKIASDPKKEYFINLLHKMLHQIPCERWSAEDLLTHPFFQETPHLMESSSAICTALSAAPLRS